MMELVSVIIPVYMVEKYLRRCLDSVINQTYRKLDVLVIDDGSNDDCGRICDEYASNDNRIRVIHQENKGLAEVRNIGVREALGNYILFVDSDDWIDLNLVEVIYSELKKNHVDVVCFGMNRVDEKGHITKVYRGSYGKKVLDTTDALDCIFFSKYVDVVSCNKMFSKWLFDGISYPSGRLYEDMATTYKIIEKANKVLCLSEAYYFYYNNINSIGNRKFTNETMQLDNAARECYEHCVSVRGTNEDSLVVGLWKWQLVIVNMMIKSRTYKYGYINKLQKNIKLLKVISCDYLPAINKIQFAVFKCSFAMYKRMYLFFKRR